MLFTAGKFLVGQGLKRPGRTVDLLMKGADLVGTGYVLGQLPGMSSRTNKELARDFDIKDIDGAYEGLGLHQKLPFIGATKEGLESQIRKQEQKEIEASTVYQTAAGYLDADQMPDISGMSKTQARTALGTATRNVREERETRKQEKEFLSPANRYLMETAERNRRDDNNRFYAQQAQQMDMYRMGLEREDRRDRREAKMQLVAALTGSLGNLGDAFLSI